MLTLVEVRTPQGSLLALPLEDISNGYIVEDIDGLDPVKATLSSSSSAKKDGEQYQGGRREPRDLKITLELYPDHISTTAWNLRNALYSYLMPKSQVFLRFYMLDGLTVDIEGRVENFSGKLFSDTPKVDIDIRCFDPDFVDLNPVTISGSTTSSTDEILISYPGTIATGIKLVLNVDRSLSEFTVYHRPPDGSIRTLEFAGFPLVAGDVLTISTIVGAKGAILARDLTSRSVLYGVSPQAVWTELSKGDNYIRVFASGAPIPFDITYTALYGGL